MNQKITKLLALAFIASASFSQAISNNHYMGRGFSNNMANELINVSKAYCDNGGDVDGGWFGNLMVTGSYNGSFNNKRSNGLGSMFSFGGSEVNSMKVGGVGAGTTAVAGLFNVDAYQLGMGSVPTGSTLKMQLDPKVYSAGADFMLYVGANKMETGFWFKAHGAVGVMAVNPNLSEEGTIGTSTGYAAGSVGPTAAIAAASVYTTMADAFAAKTALATDYKQMKYGKIDGKQTTGAKFGDIELALGYNFLADEDKVVGLGLRALVPTANKPKGDYVFEPIFGHGGNWGLGGELFVKATLWSSDEDDKCLNFWLDGHASHYFKAVQTRSFDATLNGAGSRYMLVAKYTNATTAITDSTTTPSLTSAQLYADEVQNLINVSTLPCSSTISVEGAVSAMFDYNCGSWNVGLGAEFWGSAKEVLKITGTMVDGYVVLGRQVRTDNGTVDATHAMGYCQPNATMIKQAAAHTTVDQGVATADIAYAGNSDSKLSASKLDATSAANTARHSAKLFANAGYKWTDSDYCPALGLTGSAEFATSKRNAISQWSIALQGGICF